MEADKIKLSPDQVAEQLDAEAGLYHFAYGEEKFSPEGLLYRCGELLFTGVDRVWRREDIPNESELRAETRVQTGLPRARSILREIMEREYVTLAGEREMRVLLMVGGFESDGRPRTLKEAGEAIGRSKSTAWELKERALDRIPFDRKVFSSHVAALKTSQKLIDSASSN